ncbi:unnamed protein product [Schistosoma margrebowiei]|uniref:Uncharacterized protein n=1 Tax=Schistosoma margrebowiei TaxID=48269 RepID=A0A183MCC0_9TREM|nr:unnamed protein product [Schistosoma margrebowiei]
MSYPSFQLIVTCSSSQILLDRMWRIFTFTSVPDFSASPGILSGPTACPFLICLMVILISSIVGGVISMGRSVGAASISDGFNGVGLFKSSLKCSTHLFLCS